MARQRMSLDGKEEPLFIQAVQRPQDKGKNFTRSRSSPARWERSRQRGDWRGDYGVLH
jgi:hypothetical protein